MRPRPRRPLQAPARRRRGRGERAGGARRACAGGRRGDLRGGGAHRGAAAIGAAPACRRPPAARPPARIRTRPRQAPGRAGFTARAGTARRSKLHGRRTASPTALQGAASSPSRARMQLPGAADAVSAQVRDVAGREALVQDGIRRAMVDLPESAKGGARLRREGHAKPRWRPSKSRAGARLRPAPFLASQRLAAPGILPGSRPRPAMAARASRRRSQPAREGGGRRKRGMAHGGRVRARTRHRDQAPKGRQVTGQGAGAARARLGGRRAACRRRGRAGWRARTGHRLHRPRRPRHLREKPAKGGSAFPFPGAEPPATEKRADFGGRMRRPARCEIGDL